MNNQQIYKFPFMTESSGGTYYSLQTFSYFSILTDGEINPSANYDDDPERLGLLFNNHHFYPITGEVYNEPIGKYMDFFQIINKYRVDLDPFTNLQNGYGNLYVLLSDHPIEHIMPKHHLSIEITDTVPAGTSKYYWFGKKRMTGGYITLAGYLGNYQRFISSVRNAGGTIARYLFPYQGNNELSGIMPEACNINSNFAFQRFLLKLENTDAIVNATIYARFDFVK